MRGAEQEEDGDGSGPEGRDEGLVAYGLSQKCGRAERQQGDGQKEPDERDDRPQRQRLSEAMRVHEMGIVAKAGIFSRGTGRRRGAFTGGRPSRERRPAAGASVAPPSVRADGEGTGRRSAASGRGGGAGGVQSSSRTVERQAALDVDTRPASRRSRRRGAISTAELGRRLIGEARGRRNGSRRRATRRPAMSGASGPRW